MDKVNVKMFNLIYSKYYPRVIDVKKLLKHVLNAWPHEDMLLKKGTPPGFLRAYFENHRASLYVQSHTTWTVLLSKGSFGDERAQGHMEGDPGLVLRLTHTPPFKEETSLLPRGPRA